MNLQFSRSTIKVIFIFILSSIVMFSTSCKKDDDTQEKILQTKKFEYHFHNGQTVPTAPYSGIHSSSLSATLLLKEMKDGNTNVTVILKNTMEGQTYNVHAHDAADASTTPNETPYIEAPNGDVYVQAITGNGGEASATQVAKMSFDKLISNYEGFFVIHDVLQEISTTDISTFLIVGGFAREQPAKTYKSKTFDYDFNTGQLVADFAYSGTHTSNLVASITIDELANNQSRVVVKIKNTMAEEVYHTHAHDGADASTTPNGTPYIEAPNTDIFVAAITGNGGMAAKANISSKNYDHIVSEYSGFLVIHDPLQAVSTTDPTTFVILGSFAR